MVVNTVVKYLCIAIFASLFLETIQAQESISAETVLSESRPIGSGGCKGEYGPIHISSGQYVSVFLKLDDPNHCAFDSLILHVNGKNLYLNRVSKEFIRMATGAYKLKAESGANGGYMYFINDKKVVKSDFQISVGLWEHLCNTGGCLTDEAVVKAAKRTYDEEKLQDSKLPYVTDVETGLMWSRCTVEAEWNGSQCVGRAKKYRWLDALRLARDNRMGGYSDWRLPYMFELAPSKAVVSRDEGLYFNVHCIHHPVASNALMVTEGSGNPFESFWTEHGMYVSDSNNNEKIVGIYDVNICYPPIKDTRKRLVAGDKGTIGEFSWKPRYNSKEGMTSNDQSMARAAWDRTSLQLEKSSSSRYNRVILVRGGLRSKMALMGIAALEKSEALDRAEADRQRSAKAEAEQRQREYDLKIEMEKTQYDSVLISTNPRAMYIAAIKYEDNGDRSKAKSIYRELLKRYSNSQEALKASDRLTKIADIEAIEGAQSRAANASYEAADSIRKQNYQQCLNERNSCYARCSSSSAIAESKCTAGCPVCAQ